MAAAEEEDGEEMEGEEEGEEGVDGSLNRRAARVVEEERKMKTKKTKRCVEGKRRGPS